MSNNLYSNVPAYLVQRHKEELARAAAAQPPAPKTPSPPPDDDDWDIPTGPLPHLAQQDPIPGRTAPGRSPFNPAVPYVPAYERPAPSTVTTSGATTAAVNRDELRPCRLCGRRFLMDRVRVHEEICKAIGQRKRKPFDPKSHRMAGTPMEPFNRGPKPQPKPGSVKKPDWRRKHQDLIYSIRAAKEVKKHSAAGGNVSDLSAPPRSDYSDYISCPHCYRNFNQTAAERHIPQCANYQHNKKAPGGASKAPGGASNAPGGASNAPGGVPKAPGGVLKKK